MKAPELKEKLHESEKLIQEMTVTWEEKLRKTEEIATVMRRPPLFQFSVFPPLVSLLLLLFTGTAKTAGEHGHLSGDIRD